MVFVLPIKVVVLYIQITLVQIEVLKFKESIDIVFKVSLRLVSSLNHINIYLYEFIEKFDL